MLAPLSRWITPRVVPRRFDVRFFAAEQPAGVEPSFVETEVVAHAWITPGDALRARADGRLGLWVPTSATLQQLEHAGSFAEIRNLLAPGTAGSIGVVDEEPGLVRLLLPAAGGVPGQGVNAYVVGQQELVIVDPGDPSANVLDTVEALATERRATIRGVAITHADADHHAGAEAIAMTLDVPIFVGPGAAAPLPYEVHELRADDVVSAGDVPLTVLETPGHRADHVCFASPSGWILSGDLVGPGPSRSIVGEPDIPAWQASLSRLESVSARRLFPGHGEPTSDVATAVAETRARLANGRSASAQS